MIDNNKNPWIDMASSTRRRVDALAGHSVFWFTDLKGNYGLYVKAGKPFDNLDKSINLKGISMVRKSPEEGSGELFLILNNNDDWQIFYILCLDLIAATKQHKTDEKLIDAVVLRLKRWHHLLQRVKNEMSMEKQMGLFSELSCLLEIIAPETGYRQAIISWVGPEEDKQDFLLDSAVVEIKSYRTSKGETVYISSLEQLYSEKQPLFLLSYALTVSDNGMNLEDIISGINKKIEEESEEIIGLFGSKLIEYGYTPEFRHKTMYKFSVDKMNCYKVVPSFPRILSNNVDSRIKTVKYSIDLTLCREYKSELSEIFKKLKAED